MIKVLIVDESPSFSDYLKSIIDSDDHLKVVGIAKNGGEAIRMAGIFKPDVVTIDIRLYWTDGFETTRRIMETNPVPILVVGSLSVNEQVETTFQAIKAGAVGALEKPKGPVHPESLRICAKVIRTIKLMSEVKVVKRMPSTWKREPNMRKIPMGGVTRPPGERIKIIAMGASTGGPPVIRSILSALRENFSIPILIVQHISPNFLKGMIRWLRRETPLPIHIPVSGEPVLGGHVYFAPDDYHMGITENGKILLSGTSPVNGVKPSVSFLFKTVEKSYGKNSASILLTGMGKDGSIELKRLRERGAVTVAQDKESSVVHGMPGKAIEIGAADYILPPNEISKLLNAFSEKR